MTNIFTACGTTSKDQKAMDERTSHQNNGTQPYIKNIGHTSNEDKTAQIPEWDAETEYVEDTIVTYKGTQYQARNTIKGGATPEETFRWKIVGGATPKWNKKKAYDKDNIVTYMGIEYIAIKGTQAGILPGNSSSWEYAPWIPGEFYMN